MEYEQRLERVDEVAEQVLSEDEYQKFNQVRKGLETGEVAPERAADVMNTLRLELVRELDEAKGKADAAYTERDEAESEETVVTSDSNVYRHGGDLDQKNREADEHAQEAADTFETFQELRGDYQLVMSMDDELRERMGEGYENRRFENGVDRLREERAELRSGDADAYDTRLEKKDLRAKES
ncbi:MAG: hypothetical protein SVU32_04775 [Candidatus Nanohaloarchaea archaeon]|nr:hypothetical protein [Candidatus Nanohaloarchaea archaeon]